MRPCPSFPGYSANEDGVVFTHRQVVYRPGYRGRFSEIIPGFSAPVKTYQHADGYLLTSVYCGGKSRNYSLHQLVADAFLGPRPEGMEVRHLDGNPSHNAPGNLAYGTPKENAKDKYRHGTNLAGSDHPSAKLSRADVHEARNMRSAGKTLAYIARQFGVSDKTIADMMKGKTYSSNG